VAHAEGNGVAVRTATKAMEKALCVVDVERGGFLVVERAARLELAACTCQFHRRAITSDKVTRDLNSSKKRLSSTESPRQATIVGEKPPKVILDEMVILCCFYWGKSLERCS
jgi:hypothetical protein